MIRVEPIAYKRKSETISAVEQEFLASGFTMADAIECGIFIEHDAGVLGKMLNWKTPARRFADAGAICFPYIWGGKNRGHRIKPLDPRRRDGKAVKYEQPRGSRNLPYAPMLIGNTAREGCTVLIVEGEKKAISTAKVFRDNPAIFVVGVSGCWNWKKKGESSFTKEFRKLVGVAGKVLWIFDSDTTTLADLSKKALDRSKQLQLAARRACECTEATRTEARLLIMPAIDAEGKTGADDFIVARGPEAMRELIKESLDSDWRHHLRMKAAVAREEIGEKILGSIDPGSGQAPADAADVYLAVMDSPEMIHFPTHLRCKNPVCGLHVHKNTGHATAGLVPFGSWRCCEACTAKRQQKWAESLQRHFASHAARGGQFYTAEFEPWKFDAAAFSAAVRRLREKTGKSGPWVCFRTKVDTIRIVIGIDPRKSRSKMLQGFQPATVTEALSISVRAIAIFEHDQLSDPTKRIITASKWGATAFDELKSRNPNIAFLLCKSGVTLDDLKEAAVGQGVKVIPRGTGPLSILSSSMPEIRTIVSRAELAARIREKINPKAGSVVTFAKGISLLGKGTTIQQKGQPSGQRELCFNGTHPPRSTA